VVLFLYKLGIIEAPENLSNNVIRIFLVGKNKMDRNKNLAGFLREFDIILKLWYSLYPTKYENAE
jgi:hypothetical protein